MTKIKKYMSFFSIVLILGSFLTACSILKKPEPEKQYFLTVLATQSSSLSPNLPIMVVDRPTANAPFNTNRILVTQPFQEIVPLPGISWSEAIPQMLQQLLVEHFQTGKLVVPLSRENGGLRAAYVLQTEIRDFQVADWQGKPTVTAIEALEPKANNAVTRDSSSIEIEKGSSEEILPLLQLAASAEASSEHPLARAIVAAAQENGLELLPAKEFRAIPGEGISALVAGKKIVVGHFRQRNQKEQTSQTNQNAQTEQTSPIRPIPQTSSWHERINYFSEQGATAVLLEIDGVISALIAISDPIKNNAIESISALQKQGIDVHMLTGDNERTARSVGEKLGLKTISAEVTPGGKHDYIAKLVDSGKRVAMAGDGINDAAALSRANVGIAMGNGTSVAIEAAGIVLVKGDLQGIVRAIKLSQAMSSNINQNLLLAFGYNAAAVPIAAGLLYPIFGLLLNPMVASMAMSLSSVSVIANALRLRQIKL